MFNSLLTLPQSCIYALVNPADKKVYISHTTRLPTRLGEMVDKMTLGTWKFPAMTQDRSKLELTILETNTEEKYFVQYFIGEYRKLGYSIYNETENLPRSYGFGMAYTASGIIIKEVTTEQVIGKFQYYVEAEYFLENVVKKNNPAGSLVYKI